MADLSAQSKRSYFMRRETAKRTNAFAVSLLYSAYLARYAYYPCNLFMPIYATDVTEYGLLTMLLLRC